MTGIYLDNGSYRSETAVFQLVMLPALHSYLQDMDALARSWKLVEPTAPPLAHVTAIQLSRKAVAGLSTGVIGKALCATAMKCEAP